MIWRSISWTFTGKMEVSAVAEVKMNALREAKVNRGISGPLFKYTVKRNIILLLVITVVFCMFTVVTNVAASLMTVEKTGSADEKTQEEFYRYLGVLAVYDRQTGAGLSYEEFAAGKNREAYEALFNVYNRSAAAEDALSLTGFEDAIRAVKETGADPDAYVHLFEYAFSLQGEKGVFTGDELELSDMVETLLSSIGISQEDLDRLQEMDFSAMITRIYFTGMGVLILFLFVIIAANGLIASQVDRGSMAYLLSAPNERGSIAFTQILYLLLAPALIAAAGCAVRIISTRILFGEVVPKRLVIMYLGLYILVEAVGGICFLCSCIFNESSKSLAFGGGFAIWCFLASLLGIFGSGDLLDMGMGVEQLSVFNKLTLVGLYDLDALKTIGTDTPDMSYVPKLAVLAMISMIAYLLGVQVFRKKDLPL